MFGRNFTDAAPPGHTQAVIDRTIALTRDRLCPDGRWITDYTRLRFVARKNLRRVEASRQQAVGTLIQLMFDA